MAGPLSAAIAYLLGSIPFGYLIVRGKKGIDVRTTGSGSTGATNVMRSLGAAGFVATFLLDLLKGFAAVHIALRLTSAEPFWIAAAAVGAILGHCFPVWLKFRGGKGVATALGVYLAIAPREAGITLAIFVLLIAVFRYVSLGSITAAGVFPVLLYALDHPAPAIVIGSAASAAIIIARHHSNIARLLNGTESRLGKKDPGLRIQDSGLGNQK
ncbi:MAG: glycerol-3-phosphate 1-O-acyltransferase PlsY [Acidobacteria bacterium]|nr:glycerol-3-phosphate 1-O-acyltransferase PlsY [Acidobacteriota bacterium]